MVELASRRGTISVLALEDKGMLVNAVFMPFGYAAAAANLLTIDSWDPQAKIPGYKYCAIAIQASSNSDT